MKVITPITITDAMLVSSSVAEDDAAEWSSVTAYALDDLVILASTHRIYRSLAGSNTNHAPTEAASAWWLDIASTNRWACLDSSSSTQTVGGTTLTVTIAPGLADGVGLIYCEAATATVSVVADAVEVYSKTVSLVRDLMVKDWYNYFFEPVAFLRNAVFFELPPYPDGIITVTLTASTSAKLGVLAAGMSSTLGWAMHGSKVRGLDYSRKDTDTFGNTVLVKRANSRALSLPLQIPSDDADAAFYVLSGLAGIPAVWAASTRFDCTSLYGFYSEFEVDLASIDFSSITLDVQELL